MCALEAMMHCWRHGRRRGQASCRQCTCSFHGPVGTSVLEGCGMERQLNLQTCRFKTYACIHHVCDGIYTYFKAPPSVQTRSKPT